MRFGSFWQGPLDPIAYTSFASFPALGQELVVYSYGDALDLPPGVRDADAREIVPDESLTRRFLFRGRPSLAKFSNLFRFHMIAATGLCWVDADILCLRPPQLDGLSMVFGRQDESEHAHSFNGAVFWAPGGPLLRALTDAAGDAVDHRDQPWGATGPALLTRLVREHGLDQLAQPVSAFYPVGWDRFYMPLLRRFRAETRALTQDSLCLHLWNEGLKRAGYDTFACPPEGSFLHDACQRLGTIGRFERTYDEAELVSVFAGVLEMP